MARQGDGSTGHLLIPDNPLLSFPDGDWCLLLDLRLDDSAGSDYQYAFSSGNFTVSSINFYLAEASLSEPYANRWRLVVKNSANTYIISSITVGVGLTNTAFGGDGKNRLFVIQRVGSAYQVYACEPGGIATLEMSGTVSAWTALDAGAWYIGARSGLTSTTFYSGAFGEIAKGNFSLTVDEITALGNGATLFDLGYKPDLYIPAEGIDSPEPDLSGNKLNATVNGALTRANHFPINGIDVIPFIPAAGGSTTLTPTPISAIAASIVGAVVLGSVAITPTPASAAAASVAPTVVRGSVAISPAPVTAIATTVAPTVITTGSVIKTPTPISSVASTVAPSVIRGSVGITPAPVTAIATTVAPTVITTGSVIKTPTPISAVATTVAPSVIRGSVGITPAPVAAVADTVAPSVIRGSFAHTPSPITARGSVLDPAVILGSVSLTPIPAQALAYTVDPIVTIAVAALPSYEVMTVSLSASVAIDCRLSDIAVITFQLNDITGV